MDTKKDIVARLRDWLSGKWPRERALDHDLLDAILEIEELRAKLAEEERNHEATRMQDPNYRTARNAMCL